MLVTAARDPSHLFSQLNTVNPPLTISPPVVPLCCMVQGILFIRRVHGFSYQGENGRQKTCLKFLRVLRQNSGYNFHVYVGTR